VHPVVIVNKIKRIANSQIFELELSHGIPLGLSLVNRWLSIERADHKCSKRPDESNDAN
jgi:hypothetical protein